jgi:ER-derived vesicles protein
VWPAMGGGYDAGHTGGGAAAGLGGSNSSGVDVHAVVSRARKLRKDAAPYLPTLVRLLLVATFIEDGVRVLFELPHQVDFLRLQYGLPGFIAGTLLVGNVAVSFIGGALVVAQKKIARGAFETHGSYLLLACVLYQQAMYGRHSPIGSGNWGFLVRNLCLAGSLSLISCQVRLAAGQSALPLGLLDGHAPSKKQTVAYMQLASRVLLVLLAVEFITTLGVFGTVLTVPVVLAVLFGFQLEISGSILLTLYFVHNILNSSFWSVRGTYMREIMRYEFVQTLSIMGGLILMISLGPGALSVDEMRGRKAF